VSGSGNQSLREILSQCFHHKPHIGWLGLKSGQARWEDCN
jgi:hypothetical protein